MSERGTTRLPLAHRLLLRLHAGAYRADMGEGMAEMLAARWSEARAGGVLARIRFHLRESVGLAGSALRSRLGRGPGHGRSGGPDRRTPLGDRVWRETRHAARRLARSPGFTLAALATLALAIGANAAIFTVVQRVVLSPLPYAESDRLVLLDHGARGLDRARGLEMTTGLYWQYAHNARTLRDVALYQSSELTATGPEGPATLDVVRTTPSFVRALGVTPMLGRWFDEREGSPGGRLVAVLSWGTWQNRFGGDPRVLGRSLILAGHPHDVIGVMPRGFAYPRDDSDVWVPHQLDASVVRVGSFSYGGIARLAPGATVASVRAELDRLIARLPEDFPDDPAAEGVVHRAGTYSTAVPLKEWIVGSTARTLWILLGAVGIVLLVACANVANLFLVRAEARQREVSVRRALGAGRRAIAAFYVAETGVLSLAGGVLGLALAFAGVRLLVAFGPPDLPRLHEVRIDAAVVAFTLVVSALAALLLAGIPLARDRAASVASLHEGGRGNTASGTRLRARNALMGAQVALALVLLVASGLMIRSLMRMRAENPGYDARSALLVRIGLPSSEYGSRAAAAAFHERVLERVRALPGVHAAAATTCPPLTSYCFGDPVRVEGRPWADGEMPAVASFRRVSDDYFGTLGIRLLGGRLLDERDQRVATRAAVIDERMAATYFPGEDPIGRRILTPDEGAEPYEIVGIVNHVRTWGLRSDDRPPQVYLPLLTHTEANTPSVHGLSHVIRVDGAPYDLVPAVRRIIDDIDPNVPLAEVTTLEDMLAEDRAPAAFSMSLIAIAAAVSLLLGLVGIYGVVSYVVAQRAGEIGVRIALGAKPGDVAGMILWQGARVAVLGVAAGLAAAAAGSRVLTSMLYDVSPLDGLTYGLVTATLLFVALLACWLPARRAARLDPVQALRLE